MNIIGTGLTGLVGSRITELLSHTYSFENVSRKSGTDITDATKVLQKIEESSAQIVLHLAAKTDVDGCEQEKNLGEESESWKINVVGARNVAQACKKTGKKLIYISTDMVFSGQQLQGEKYSEEETPNPINWYGTTKYEGEKVVMQEGINATILRIAYPYRANFEKKEYVRVFLSLLSQKKEIWAVTDHYYTPTFIDDIAGVLDYFFKQNQKGIFHTVGDASVSPYEVAMLVAKTFGFDISLIHKITRDEYFKDRAQRGFNLSLKNDKMRQLGIKLHSINDGLSMVKSQIVSI